jgi:hypothetical protein
MGLIWPSLAGGCFEGGLMPTAAKLSRHRRQREAPTPPTSPSPFLSFVGATEPARAEPKWRVALAEDVLSIPRPASVIAEMNALFEGLDDPSLPERWKVLLAHYIYCRALERAKLEDDLEQAGDLVVYACMGLQRWADLTGVDQSSHRHGLGWGLLSALRAVAEGEAELWHGMLETGPARALAVKE